MSLPHGAVHLVPVGHVGLDRDGPHAPAPLDFLGPAFDLLEGAADERDLGAAAGQPVGDRLSQAVATGSGDEGLLAGQVHQLGHALADNVLR